MGNLSKKRTKLCCYKDLNHFWRELYLQSIVLLRRPNYAELHGTLEGSRSRKDKVVKANSALLVLSVFCLFVSSFAVRETALAATSCRLAHQKKKELPWQTEMWRSRAPKPEDLDLKKLEEQGFRVEGNKLIDTYGVTVGTLAVLDIKYIYEWAPKEYHKAWLKTGGIDDAYMKRILDMPPQKLGRGFYVSLHPTDSAMYGDALTVFPVSRPLLVLEANDYGLKDSASRLELLGKAGVDALRGQYYTWLAIISSQHLQNPKTPTQTVFKDWKEKQHPDNASEVLSLYLGNTKDPSFQFLADLLKSKNVFADFFNQQNFNHNIVTTALNFIKKDWSEQLAGKPEKFDRSIQFFRVLGLTPQAKIIIKHSDKYDVTLDTIAGTPVTFREIANLKNLSEPYEAFAKAFREAQK